jgi:hypothetical protein
LWLLTNISSAAFPALKGWLAENQAAYLSLVMVIAVARFIHKAYEPSSVSFVVPTTDTKITIQFGDLFDSKDDLLIAVNEFFDGKLGQVVSKDSVHGAFIEKLFNSDETRFRVEVDRALAPCVGAPTTRTLQPSMSYPIGGAEHCQPQGVPVRAQPHQSRHG